jgi:hypothetical protein
MGGFPVGGGPGNRPMLWFDFTDVWGLIHKHAGTAALDHFNPFL